MAFASADCIWARTFDCRRGRCIRPRWLGDRSARTPHRRRSDPDRLGTVRLAFRTPASRARRHAGGAGGARGVVISHGNHARRRSDAVAGADAALLPDAIAAVLDRTVA